MCSVNACNYTHSPPPPPHPWCVRACMQMQLHSIQHVCSVNACNYTHPPRPHPIRGVYEHVCKCSCIASNMCAQSMHAITPIPPAPTPSVLCTSMYANAVAWHPTCVLSQRMQLHPSPPPPPHPWCVRACMQMQTCVLSQRMQLHPFPPPPPHPWCVRACMQMQLHSIQHVCSVSACNYIHPPAPTPSVVCTSMYANAVA